jgi:ADP-ribose pyrophosphatase YjhB (NUDIX family)
VKYCLQCATPVDWLVPAGDHLPRHVCPGCGYIHYVNPRMIVGCIVAWQDQVLLCRRAIDPRAGFWTVPAGFMENNETAAQGAARETLEEANAHVEIESLYAVLSLPHVSQVYLLFKGQLREPIFGPSPESLEVKLFHQHQIPWDNMAFASVRRALQSYFDDRARDQFPTRYHDIVLTGERF